MEILFTYPAKAYLLVATRNARMLQNNGHEYAVFDNINIYAKTGESPRFAYQAGNGWSSYALQVAPSIYVYVTEEEDDERFKQRVNARGAEFIDGILERAKEVLADIDGYNARLKALITERNEIQQSKNAMKEQARLAYTLASEEKGARTQMEAEARFKAGEGITWSAFETACKNYGVKMAISTRGSGGKRVRSISTTIASISGYGPLGQGIWDAAKSLKTQMGA